MMTLNPQYITDNKGNKLSVVLSVEEFKSILKELEDLEDVRLYNEAKKERQIFISAEQAFKEIENERTRGKDVYN